MKYKKYKINFLKIFIMFMILNSNIAFAISPVPKVIIDKEIITLGDIFPDIENNREYILAPAPKAGSEMILKINDLNKIAKAFAFDIDWSNFGDVKQTIIKRKKITKNKNIIDSNLIENAIAKAIKKKMLGNLYEIELAETYKKIEFLSNNEPSIIVKKLNFNNSNPTFKANILLKDKDIEKNIKIIGSAYRLVKVPVLKNRLSNGDVITKFDIKYIMLRAKNISANTILDAKKLLGKTPRRYIGAMRNIQLTDVVSPKIVKKGERVSVSIKKGALNLSIVGKALTDGALGDVIKIVNLSSNKVIEAKIIGVQQAVISNI